MTLKLETAIKPAALALAGVALLLAQPAQLSREPAILAILLVAGLLLGMLPIRLPGVMLPVSLMSLVLAPTWLLFGGWITAALAIASRLLAGFLHAPVRLPLEWQLAASLFGVGLGSMLGTIAGALLTAGGLWDLARPAAFVVGQWAGQCATEWLGPDAESARPSWPVSLLTKLALVPPALFLAQQGLESDLAPFVTTLTLAVVLLFLVRALTNSETRTAELEVQAAGSAQARDQLELIVDHAPEALFGMDADGNVRWLNRTAAEWLAETADEVVGRPARLAVPVRTAGGSPLDHAELLARAAELGRPVHEEGLLEGAPGAPERVLASYSWTVDQSSGDIGLVLLRDAGVVTESLREQEELAVHLSHELRAPLTTILGYAQLMANPNSQTLMPNAQNEFARRISESGDYMLRLVNNLLDLGRLDRPDGEALHLAPVDTVALTREVIAAHKPQASEKGQELSFQGPPASLEITTSDLDLRQILTNLLGNAIKYTPPSGHVQVLMDEQPTSVTWRIVDDGIGLSPEEQTKLFTKFFRSQRPEARLIKGTGLGLALTKALVDRLGATIEVQSELDRGSSFTLTLPR